MELDAELQDQYRKKFWNYIEKSLHMPVKKHIKNIFKFCDLDNGAAIFGFKERGLDLKNLRDFVRSDAYSFFITAELSSSHNHKKEEYFGKYQNASEFEFSLGEESILKQILEICWNDKSNKFFKLLGSKYLKRINTSTENFSESNFSVEINEENEISKIKSLLLNENQMQKRYLPELRRQIKTQFSNIKYKFSTENGTLRVTLFCPQCKVGVQIRKTSDSPNVKGKWLLFNFHRHYNKHNEKNENTEEMGESSDQNQTRTRQSIRENQNKKNSTNEQEIYTERSLRKKINSVSLKDKTKI